MTIDAGVRAAVAPRHEKLTAAVESIARILDAPAEVEAVAFDFEQKTFVRAAADHVVWARRNDAQRAWVVGCRSEAPAWESSWHRCDGRFSVDAALEWGEALWRAHAQ